MMILCVQRKILYTRSAKHQVSCGKIQENACYLQIRLIVKASQKDEFYANCIDQMCLPHYGLEMEPVAY